MKNKFDAYGGGNYNSKEENVMPEASQVSESESDEDS